MRLHIRTPLALALASLVLTGCATEPAVSPAPTPSEPVEVRLHPDDVDRVARRVAELMGPRTVAPVAMAPVAVRPTARPTSRPARSPRASVPGEVTRRAEIPDPVDPGAPSDALLTSARQAVAAASTWLRENQRADGAFADDARPNHTTGLTALAVLALMADPAESEANASAIRRGVGWLQARADAEGRLTRPVVQQYMYEHAYATLALLHYARRNDDDAALAVARRGVDFILRARNPYMGWRYGVRDGDNDTSVTALMVHVLDQAADAGIEVDDGAFRGAANWVEKMRGAEVGRIGYINRGGSAPRTMESIDRFPSDMSEAPTAMGIHTLAICAERLGEEPDLRKSANVVTATLPSWDEDAGSIDLYYWYWGTLAMEHAGGAHWNAWRANLIPALTDHQRSDETGERGSWDPVGAWGVEGGRIYSTAVSSMALANSLGTR